MAQGAARHAAEGLSLQFGRAAPGAVAEGARRRAARRAKWMANCTCSAPSRAHSGGCGARRVPQRAPMRGDWLERGALCDCVCCCWRRREPVAALRRGGRRFWCGCVSFARPAPSLCAPRCSAVRCKPRLARLGRGVSPGRGAQRTRRCLRATILRCVCFARAACYLCAGGSATPRAARWPPLRRPRAATPHG